MEVVIDASAVMAVVFNEPEREAVQVATRDAVLLAPGSLPWEVGNAVVRAVRRRRISADQAVASLSAFQSVPIRLVEIDVAGAVALACKCGLYAYDAYVLELARSLGLPLLTLDARLMSAADSIGVPRWEVL